jgi:hypothetical protein
VNSQRESERTSAFQLYEFRGFHKASFLPGIRSHGPGRPRETVTFHEIFSRTPARAAMPVGVFRS